MTEDPYLRDIKQKAVTSDLMSEICEGTLRNSPYARVVDGWDMPFLDFSGKYLCVVHSAGGDPNENDVGKHAASLVDRLVAQAKSIGATPVAFSNVIDANKIEGGMDVLIKNALLSRANHYRLIALRGETAILGSRVRDVNMSGTMISIVPKDGRFTVGTFTDENTHTKYAIFDPGKELVTANSDGIGTKTDCYDRADKREEGVDDEFAMLDDDTSRYGGCCQGFFKSC